ncbi:MAG: 30S ribosomal protein S4 [Candidatus Azambacteria bacterium]|nr:30S ribosomal protein S4 [Candidatus Azambacteria bacterium]
MDIFMEPKCRKCRRAGEKLFLKGERCATAKCAVTRRPGPPGIHGAKRKKRGGSEYGTQLAEKQKVKRSYGIQERQFRKYYEASSKKTGNTLNMLAILLETRLDNIAFRLGFAASRSQARQMVGHGHLMVNGRRVDIPSYQITKGDVITIRPGSVSKKIFLDIKTVLKKYEPPKWLAMDAESLKGEMAHVPAMDELDVPFNLQLITELYSR